MLAGDLGGHGRGEGARFGPEDLRLAEGLVKRAADDGLGRVGQSLKFGVGPDDTQVGIDDGDSVGNRVQDLFGLDHHPDPAHGRELRRIDVDGVEFLVAQEGKRLRDRSNGHPLKRFGKPVEARLLVRAVAINYQKSRLWSHTAFPQADRSACRTCAGRPKRTPPVNDDRDSNLIVTRTGDRGKTALECAHKVGESLARKSPRMRYRRLV